MNRIVREHYPVSKLPEDLRWGFGPEETVRVTVAAAETASAAEGETLLQRRRRVRRDNYALIEEIDAYVRSLRE